MKKCKLISAVLCISMFLTYTVSAYAQSDSLSSYSISNANYSEYNLETRNKISSDQSIFAQLGFDLENITIQNINSSNDITYKVQLPYNVNNYIKVDRDSDNNINLDIVAGTVVKTWSNVQFSGPNIINYFTFNRINQLEQKGTYYATATIKLYSGTILKETVTVKTSSDTY